MEEKNICFNQENPAILKPYFYKINIQKLIKCLKKLILFNQQILIIQKFLFPKVLENLTNNFNENYGMSRKKMEMDYRKLKNITSHINDNSLN